MDVREEALCWYSCVWSRGVRVHAKELAQQRENKNPAKDPVNVQELDWGPLARERYLWVKL